MKNPLFWCVCLTKSEPFLNGTDRRASRAKLNARAGREGKGLKGKGIPAPPSLSPPPNFVLVKLARHLKIFKIHSGRAY